MSGKKSILAVAAGSAFIVTLGAVPVASAADNPFALHALDAGYMVADAGESSGKKDGEGKCGEGKCGEGKCGGSK
ncbi:HvfA family oxazolone/thioamide-modified RiPP metallophore [Nitrosospira briensis]|uniref:HvfA family oxazolone/thioamide-modified RiPP metallophore n=1 Tax=Nitrosospira briensis TaxID=35799 RepID=UPI0008F2F88B|nr:hypothetical protein [Nitrosospira briensis]SFN85695.1 hypothetical protein SAMN05216332_10292 [Nitrosospira briensis]